MPTKIIFEAPQMERPPAPQGCSIIIIIIVCILLAVSIYACIIVLAAL